MNEMETINYCESLSDFSSLIQERGAHRVALDFEQAFPKQHSELVSQLHKPVVRQVAALFKP